MEIEELETFQQQALEISPPGDGFDPTKLPQNGAEYLMHMLYERKRCPAVVVKRPSRMDQMDSNTNSIALRESKMCFEVLPDCNLLPTIEWKNTQSSNFIITRSKVIILRQHSAEHYFDNILELPLITDELAWLKFCQQNPPVLSVILRLNQRTLEKLLTMLCDWLKGTNSDKFDISTAAAASATVFDLACSHQWLGDWLYAVLSCLHLPLEPDVHSTLRDIARSCMHLRSRLKSNEFEKAIPYNLFIYLIGKIFDQLDILEYV